jgi:hypothetical protein
MKGSEPGKELGARRGNRRQIWWGEAPVCPLICSERQDMCRHGFTLGLTTAEPWSIVRIAPQLSCLAMIGTTGEECIQQAEYDRPAARQFSGLT